MVYQFLLNHSRKISILLLSIYLLSIYYFLNDYFLFNSYVILGLLMIPYVLLVQKGMYSYKYLYPTLGFLLLLYFIPAQSVVFLVLLFGALFLIESSIGKVHILFPILLFLLSPIFHYISNVFSFPIRMMLTNFVGQIFEYMNFDVQVLGNLIVLNGQEFSVDPACAGLMMLTISFILSVFIMAHYQRKGKEVSFLSILKVLFITLVLNILSNLCRIFLLVLFKIMPDHYLHDVVGIICLALYVLLPMVFITKKIVQSTSNVAEPPSKTTLVWKAQLLSSTILMFAFFLASSNSHPSITNKTYHLSSFTATDLANGVLKFQNEKALIYIKPLNFYNAEHSPLVCWTGSGYEFRSITEDSIGGFQFYSGILHKDGDEIYTAWWFENATHKTIRQFEWRWDAIKNKNDYYLLNVNAPSKKELMELVQGFHTGELKITN